MGLDWIPENKAKPGYEDEFDKLLEIKWEIGGVEWKSVSDRFEEISITPYETLGAPQVGRDKEADDWLWKVYQDRKLKGTWEEVLQKMKGYWVCELVPPCDGMPKYTNSPLYGALDLSFRGKLLDGCEEIIGDENVSWAWGDKYAAEALDYGNELLRLAAAYAAENDIDMTRIVGRKLEAKDEREELLGIVVAAGKWCVFYGERGHGILADF